MKKQLMVTAATLGLLTLGLAACSATKSDAQTSKPKDKLTVVFLPSDSTKEAGPVRNDLSKLIQKATGRPVEVQTTTDYNMAIQAISSNKAQIAVMGPDSYIEARNQNKHVNPLVTYSGASGTLKDAFYHSYLMVPKDKADRYREGGEFSLKALKGKSISFVAATSTSGFAVPAGAIAAANHVKKTDLQQGGAFFSKVLYGQSHQGSAVNVLKGDVDVAAFDDVDLVHYGKFDGDMSKAGTTFTVDAKAEAPFDAVRGKSTVAIGTYSVQNGPIVMNDSGLSKSEISALTKALTSQSTTDNPHFFALKDSKVHGLTTQTGKVHYIAITDDWYAPTHKILDK
ncbi:phosphate/phosphite/phosphonate ABC transporter substrate-binding protein [Lacticaseibacillus saniviri]|uniref:Phosphate phosphite phosphonate ABC transporter, periplasmic binding protein n=1 Tax=Lacticaseibacillus saniviri JCM 17471 = DSM 24301 TaxID=1293598 RepID=A0A0R2MTR9_9LACO|nr:phosphate/phosphite/phosphonate ABC transporter substrate-binding protein [Lacticaseibacillus saniviri]KRO17000.1 phosphate phosphite phosphonate ABC transporter, periplasmic binding protein [Lacticaseibacillus saniviri JCM 17471 = DSM 24301]MCG4281929.1 phosphate/phosphite/phosphonate ABC transporter substrate-binding protein [Lacticaseibacillus saniviri]